MRAAVVAAAAVLLLAGCGGSGGAHRSANHHQPRIVVRLTGKAAEKIGAAACKHLPAGQATDAGALRAYLQKNHPTDDVDAMLNGCRAERSR